MHVFYRFSGPQRSFEDQATFSPCLGLWPGTQTNVVGTRSCSVATQAPGALSLTEGAGGGFVRRGQRWSQRGGASAWLPSPRWESVLTLWRPVKAVCCLAGCAVIAMTLLWMTPSPRSMPFSSAPRAPCWKDCRSSGERASVSAPGTEPTRSSLTSRSATSSR